VMSGRREQEFLTLNPSDAGSSDQPVNPNFSITLTRSAALSDPSSERKKQLAQRFQSSVARHPASQSAKSVIFSSNSSPHFFSQRQSRRPPPCRSRTLTPTPTSTTCATWSTSAASGTCTWCRFHEAPFWPKTFQTFFRPQILDTFPPKNNTHQFI
jgi:hypothetical protein